MVMEEQEENVGEEGEEAGNFWRKEREDLAFNIFFSFFFFFSFLIAFPHAIL